MNFFMQVKTMRSRRFRSGIAHIINYVRLVHKILIVLGIRRKLAVSVAKIHETIIRGTVLKSAFIVLIYENMNLNYIKCT